MRYNFHMHLYKHALVALSVLGWCGRSWAATLAYDDAADPAYNSLGNYHGLNGGFGLNAWVTNSFPFGGNPALTAYIGTSTINDGGNLGPDIDTAGRAWGNNAQPTGNTLTIRRNCVTPVPVGGAISVLFDTGDVDLRETVSFGDGNNVLCSFYYDAANANYQFVDATNPAIDTGIQQTFTGLSLTVSRLTSNTYQFDAVRLSDSAAYSFAGSYNNISIANLRTLTVTNFDGGNGPGHSMYINSIKEVDVIPEPGVLVLTALGMLAISRRRL